MMKKILPNWLAARIYAKWGARVGDMASYSYLGESIGFRRALRKWIVWEKEYAQRGFKTISPSSFIAYGGGFSSKLSGYYEKRPPDELPTYFALAYCKLWEKAKKRM